MNILKEIQHLRENELRRNISPQHRSLLQEIEKEWKKKANRMRSNGSLDKNSDALEELGS